MSQSISVSLVQQQFPVGAVKQNSQQVIELAQQAATDLVIFPELTLTGYPPEDLLLRNDLMQLVEEGLADIQAANYSGIIIVGHPWRENGALYNAVSAIAQGQLLGRYFKQSLPNFGVFDEQRYFTAGSETFTFTFKQQTFSLLICEDVWQGHSAAAAKAAGADWALVLNASPYDTAKISQRQHLLTTLARRLNLGFVYVNQAQGQDELVFDGSSMLVDPTGAMVLQAPSFTRDIYRATLHQQHGVCSASHQLQLPAALSFEAEVYQALVMATRDYITQNGFPGAVLGLSGGIDSALTLAIAADAIGADKVQALMLPFRYTSSMSVEDATEQANIMGIKFDIVSIEPMYDSFMQQLAPIFAGKPVDTTEENLQARLRGVLLMALSNKTGRMLLTTGNKSEVAVGYCTLYGDMCGGFAVIKDVPKTLVFRLAAYRNSISPVIPQRVIDRPPSAELAPGQTDQDNLPPYDDLDAMIEAYVEQDKSLSEIVAMGYAEETVRRVLNLIDLNEYKRRQSAVGPKITSRNFGKDRRYPITSAMRKQR
ncbi:MAG: NAD+ synthase [Gammaproteobacteria bacterium]|nr:NAD+ synthase [Gammaproteobacteria bacterium]